MITLNLFGPNFPAHHLPLSAQLINSNQFITKPFISLNYLLSPRERPEPTDRCPGRQLKPSNYGARPD